MPSVRVCALSHFLHQNFSFSYEDICTKFSANVYDPTVSGYKKVVPHW